MDPKIEPKCIDSLTTIAESHSQMPKLEPKSRATSIAVAPF